MTNSKTGKKNNDADRLIPQIALLRKMSEGADAHSVRQYHIQELAAALGSDEGEAQRSLFILEGHKFVSPNPAGDFTSKMWQITEGGLQIARSLATPNRIL
ncbi:MAG: hypothetical protein ACOX2O_08160 [Bdellovibrionota bacterium]|jgi:hypothetical protein